MEVVAFKFKGIQFTFATRGNDELTCKCGPHGEIMIVHFQQLLCFQSP